MTLFSLIVCIEIFFSSSMMIALKEHFLGKWAKDLSDLAKVAGMQHSLLLMMRRALYLKLISSKKGAKSSVKRLQPSQKYLFGGKVGEVCKDLKASEELNPLASYSKNGGKGRKNSYTPFNKKGGGGRGRGGYRGGKSFRGGGANSGGTSRGGSSRTDRFKDN